MIAFWVTRAASFGIGNYRSHRGAAIADRFDLERRRAGDLGGACWRWSTTSRPNLPPRAWTGWW